MELTADDGKSLKSLLTAVNTLVKKVEEKIDTLSERMDRNFAELKLQMHDEIAEAKTAACEALELAQQSDAKAAEALRTAVQCKEAVKLANEQRDYMKYQFEESQSEKNELQEEVNHLNNYSRKNNLVIRGITEKKDENCNELIRNFLKNNLQLSAECVDSLQIARSHRLGGPPPPGQKWVRPIIMRFSYYRDRQVVWNARAKLAKSNLTLSENFSKDTDFNRRKLYPIYNFAKKSNTYEGKVALFEDTLLVNSVKYSVNNLNSLPPDLHPKHFCSKSNASAYVFGGILSEAHPFSNWYSTPMNFDGQSYANLEQAYMYHKAIENNDMKAARAIKFTVNPRKIKKLGSAIKMPDKDKWDAQKAELMVKLVRAKFSENESLKKSLLDTGDRKLGESGRDTFFSMGLPLTSRDVLDHTKWRGKNHLGQALEIVRDELRG